MPKAISKAQALQLERLSKVEGKKILLYHNDPDGISSASLFLRFFPNFETNPRKGPMIDESYLKVLIEKKPDLLIFLDIPVDQEKEKLEILMNKNPKLRVVIIDHHIAEYNLNSRRVLHINPRFFKKDTYIPAACIIYKFLQAIGKDVKKYSWVSVIGIIGDYGLSDCNDVLEECRLEHPYLLKGNPMKSKLFEATKVISSAVTLKGLKGAGEALKILKGSDYFEDLMGVKKLKDWRAIVDEEIKKLIDEYPEKKQTSGDVIFYKIETRLNLVSVIATMISEKNEDKVIVIRKKTTGGWKFSARNQSGRFNLGVIIKNSVKGIGSGGGHEKAAAGIVSKWLMFKKKFLEEIKASEKS